MVRGLKRLTREHRGDRVLSSARLGVGVFSRGGKWRLGTRLLGKRLSFVFLFAGALAPGDA